MPQSPPVSARAPREDCCRIPRIRNRGRAHHEAPGSLSTGISVAHSTRDSRNILPLPPPARSPS
jgi:hypothetical protein